MRHNFFEIHFFIEINVSRIETNIYSDLSQEQFVHMPIFSNLYLFIWLI